MINRCLLILFDLLFNSYLNFFRINSSTASCITLVVSENLECLFLEVVCINLIVMFLFSGLLTSLSGLNLAGNPLQIPPKSIVELGTKVFY